MHVIDLINTINYKELCNKKETQSPERNTKLSFLYGIYLLSILFDTFECLWRFQSFLKFVFVLYMSAVVRYSAIENISEAILS